MPVEFAPCDLHEHPDPAAERFLVALNSDMHHRLKDSSETLGRQNRVVAEMCVSCDFVFGPQRPSLCGLI